MPMDLTEASQNFDRATQHCDNLITVHRGYGGPAGGRRGEVSLNRAVIVLTVASWQSAVQDLTLALLDAGTPVAGGAITPASYAVIAGRVRKEVGDFATPNAQNTRRLMVGVGFDPRPHWTWRQMGGRGVGMITLSPTDVDRRMDEWLKIRHAIAHGHSELPQVSVLAAVRRATGVPPTDPTIRLVDAEQCLAFFRRVVSLTTSTLAVHLGVQLP